MSEVLHECGVCGAPVADENRDKHNRNCHSILATLGVPVYLYPSYPRYDTEPCIVVQVTGRYLGDGWREKVEAVYAKLREVFPQSPLGSTLDEARAHRRQNPEYVEAENRIAALARKLAETHGCSETDTDEDVDEFFQQHRDEYEGLAVTAISWLAEQALPSTES